jgi:hypothetical protein
VVRHTLRVPSRKRRATGGEAATFSYPASATTARSNRSPQSSRASRTSGAASTQAQPAQTSIRLSAPAERLRAAFAARAQLLDRVARRKAALETAENAAREAAVKVASVMEPRWAALHTLDHELHELLAALSSDPGRSKRDRKTLTRLHQTLQHRGMLTARWPEPKQGQGSRAGEQAPGASPWDDDLGPSEDSDAHGPHASGGRRGFFPQEDVASAPRPKESQHGGLRALFRRLVEAFHPDKVQDEREKTERTEVMKEITSAYRRGDLARLLELERQGERAGLEALEAAAPPEDADELERRLVALDQSCDELREQLKELERAVRLVRRSPQSKVALEIKRAKRDGYELVDFDVVRDLDAAAAQLRKARDLCASYREGGITLAQLLTSPPIMDPDEDEDDELLDLITQLAQQMIQEERPRAAPDVRAARDRRPRR